MNRFGKRPIAALGVALVAGAAGFADAGETTRASVHTSGTQSQFGNSIGAALSSSGRFVVFESEASFLADGDDGRQHIYLRDRETPLTERISVSTAGVSGNFGSLHPSVSSDGRFVVFQSQSTNLVAPATTFARFHVFLRDRALHTTILVSAAPGGGEGNQHSSAPSITVDGRYVVFESTATNLTNPPGNLQKQILRYDRTTGAIVLVSLHDDGALAASACAHPTINDDGNLVAFHTTAILDAEIPGGNSNAYVRDIAGAETRLVSVASSGVTGGNSHSTNPVLSADGTHVAFESIASNLLGDVWNGRPHIYVRDLALAVTLRVSANAAGEQGNHNSYSPAISANGAVVAFESQASNLVAADVNGWSDIFVVRTGNPPAVERASVRDTSVLGPGEPEDGNGWSWLPAINASGTLVAFQSWSTDLVAGDTNGFADIFARTLELPAVAVQSSGADDGKFAWVWPQPTTVGRGANVRYESTHGFRARISIVDVAGRSVRTLAERETGSPSGTFRWDGRDATGRTAQAGVYFVEFETEGGRAARKLVILPSR